MGGNGSTVDGDVAGESKAASASMTARLNVPASWWSCDMSSLRRSAGAVASSPASPHGTGRQRVGEPTCEQEGDAAHAPRNCGMKAFA